MNNEMNKETDAIYHWDDELNDFIVDLYHTCEGGGQIGQIFKDEKGVLRLKVLDPMHNFDINELEKIIQIVKDRFS